MFCWKYVSWRVDLQEWGGLLYSGLELSLGCIQGPVLSLVYLREMFLNSQTRLCVSSIYTIQKHVNSNLWHPIKAFISCNMVKSKGEWTFFRDYTFLLQYQKKTPLAVYALNPPNGPFHAAKTISTHGVWSNPCVFLGLRDVHFVDPRSKECSTVYLFSMPSSGAFSR